MLMYVCVLLCTPTHLGLSVPGPRGQLAGVEGVGLTQAEFHGHLHTHTHTRIHTQTHAYTTRAHTDTHAHT
jgi:hypothetical protein